MRVLHIGKYFPPYAGGMETYLRDSMIGLSRKGVNNSALVHQSSLGLRSNKEPYEYRGETLDVTRVAVWARVLFTPLSPMFGWHLHRKIKHLKPDILHIHMPNVSAFWVLMLPQSLNIPVVIQWQSDVLSSEHSLGLRLFYRLYKPFEQLLLRRSKAIIVATPPYLDSSIPLRPHINKCHVIPLGLDPTTIMPASSSPPKAMDFSKDPPELNILAVGRLSYYKGFGILIKALAKTKNIRLNLVGTGDQSETLKYLAKDLGIEKRIIFHGKLPADKLQQLFSNCDCLCLPSIERTEAYGLVLLEAMCWSKATISSDIPGSGMSWIVDHDVTGLKFPPGDSEELAFVLQNIEKDRVILRQLGSAGRRKFEQEFTIEKCATRIIALYQDLVTLH